MSGNIDDNWVQITSIDSDFDPETSSSPLSTPEEKADFEYMGVKSPEDLSSPTIGHHGQARPVGLRPGIGGNRGHGKPRSRGSLKLDARV